MATMKLTKPNKETKTQNSGQTAVAKAEPTQLAKPMVDQNAAGVEGDFGADDLEMPYLQLLQPNSPKVEELGSDRIGHYLVPTQELDFGDSFRALVCGMRKRYEEILTDSDRKANPDKLPRIFDTEAAANEAGCVNGVKPMAYLNLAIEVEEGSDAAESAAFSHDGKGYVLAIYSARGRSYAVSKTVYSAWRRFKDTHLCGHVYEFHSVTKPAMGVNFRVTYANAQEATPEELQNLVLKGVA